MSKNKIQIEDQFVHQLFRHAGFQHELTRFIKKGDTTLANQPAPVPMLIEEISQLLTQNFRESVDQQSLTVYQTCSQLTKEIETMKSKLTAWESGKEVSFEKQRQEMSILSQICEQERKSTFNTQEKLPPYRDSFMGSLLNDTGVKDLREEIEEKLKSSALNMSADLAKIERGVMQRLKLYEVGVNKKIENIFKTLSSVFETINDLQLRHPGDSAATTKSKTKLKQLFDTKLLSSKDKDKSMEVAVNMTEDKDAPRRRSFLGFKY